MKKIIKILISIIFVVIIIIISLLFNIKQQNESLQIIEDPDDPTLSKVEVDNTVRLVYVRNDFYIVKSCINKFFSYYMEYNSNENNQYVIDEEQEDNNKEVLFSMLDDEYIKSKNITKDNILDKLPKLTETTIQINKMYNVQQNENISIYFANGIFNDKINNTQTDFSIAVRVDVLNKTFKLMLEDYIKERFNNIRIGEKIDLTSNDKEISNNEYNIFDYQFILDEQYVTDIFNKLREDLIYNPDLVYNSLNDE